MVAALRENDSFTELWCIGVPDPAGSTAAGQLDVGGAPTEVDSANGVGPR